MQEIIFQQRNAAKPLTGRAFVLSMAGILLRLAIAQIAVDLLISATGAGIVRIALYLYAALLLIGFMRDTAAGYVYTLREDMLVLERRLGDSTIATVKVPLGGVASLRPICMAENLRISYPNVMHIDAASRPPLRVRAAFAISLLSSRLARLAAGRRAQDVIGHVIVYDEGTIRRACTFCPNEEMLARLQEIVQERCGFDERMTHAKVRTLYGRALERAFPALYPFVDPLVRYEDVAWAREEIKRQRAERRARKEKPDAAGKKAGQESSRESSRGSDQGNNREETAQTDGGQGDAPRRRRKQG